MTICDWSQNFLFNTCNLYLLCNLLILCHIGAIKVRQRITKGEVFHPETYLGVLLVELKGKVIFEMELEPTQDVLKRDWEQRRIFKDSWIRTRVRPRLKVKKEIWRISCYLKLIPTKIEGKKRNLKDLGANPNLFRSRVSTWYVISSWCILGHGMTEIVYYTIVYRVCSRFTARWQK